MRAFLDEGLVYKKNLIPWLDFLEKMAKTYKSIRAKGRKAEKEVAKIFRETGIDKNARRQLLSGASYLKGDINTSIGYTVEVKKQEKYKSGNGLSKPKSKG